MDNTAIEVEWLIAEDEGMKRIVKSGKAVTAPAFAHSVHVALSGLASQCPFLVSVQGGKRGEPRWPRNDGAHTRSRPAATEIRGRLLPELGSRTVDRLRSHAGGQSGPGDAPGRLHLRRRGEGYRGQET